MDYSQLPKIDTLVRLLEEEAPPCSRGLLVRAARQAVAQLRAGLPHLPAASRETLFCQGLDLAKAEMRRLCRPDLRLVLNATGVPLHTNLGRAPLAEAAVQAMVTAARHYTNLELDLETGRRGDRNSHVIPLLQELTGAEDALVVNNNAAAVFLIVNTLAAGGEAVISRGQLVEIGGGFRVADIIQKSGASLAEVGASNRVYERDYAAAINERTKLLLHVHPSNFAQAGYVGGVDVETLACLAHSHGLPLYDDLGSGCLYPLAEQGIGGEPLVSQVMAAGVDIASFSGDKLLGGPQAGIIVGKGEYIRCLRANPLSRALRVDKFTLAALEATLLLYRAEKAAAELPALGMLLAKPETLRARALRLAELINGCPAAVRLADGVSEAGGGSLPLVALPTTLVTLKPWQLGSGQVAEALRQGEPALLCYIREDKIILDPRTLRDEDIPLAADLIKQVFAALAPAQP